MALFKNKIFLGAAYIVALEDMKNGTDTMLQYVLDLEP